MKSKKQIMQRKKFCPCHSNKKYSNCCEPYHKGAAPPTAEALMRSRYAAYALGLVDYVMDTTDPKGSKYKSPREKWRADLISFCKSTQFLGLEILSSSENMVTFKVNLVQHGKPSPFVERSIFTRPNGRWLYFDGLMI
ncbi:MAG: YchJ family metal-binding protein [Chloroflexota bacterium]